jgi:hypothetical protein
MATLPNVNISSLTNPSLIANAKSQLSSQAKEKVTQSLLSKSDILKNQIQNLKQEITNKNKEYNTLIQNISNDYSLPSEEEKNSRINNLHQQKDNEIKLLNDEIKRVEDDLKNLINDPLQKVKEEKKKTNDAIDKNIKKSKSDKTKANAQRNKQVLKNTAKSLAPVVTNSITNNLIKILGQTSKLQDLVNKTNEIIDNAKTADQIKQAIIAKNNTISIINTQEQKIIPIQNTIKRIDIILSFTNVIVNVLGTVLLPIPVPSPAPDVVTTPKENFRKRVYEPALLLLNALSSVLPIVSTQLENLINTLEDLKKQLRDVGDVLNNPQADPNVLASSDVLGTMPIGLFPETYKAFKFAIKEETGPNAIVVLGNKRHFAVAIDRNNVEVLKSELSFTLDPNDLIDQLKIIIDRENLIA